MIKKMGDFIEPGTHRSTNIKVKIETLQKKSGMYFSYCIEYKDFIYAFSNCSVKQNIDDKKHKHKGYAKMHKISEILLFKANFHIEWVESPL